MPQIVCSLRIWSQKMPPSPIFFSIFFSIFWRKIFSRKNTSKNSKNPKCLDYDRNAFFSSFRSQWELSDDISMGFGFICIISKFDVFRPRKQSTCSQCLQGCFGWFRGRTRKIIYSHLKHIEECSDLKFHCKVSSRYDLAAVSPTFCLVSKALWHLL